jgi:N-acetylmuramoyl-L-alanine amidase
MNYTLSTFKDRFCTLIVCFLTIFNNTLANSPLPVFDLGCKYTALGNLLQSDHTIKKIVLDAGHGGKDPGCHGLISKEKNNTLAIVLALGNKIKSEFPDIEVIYTRDKDVFVELYERANIANRNKADLFISVHCNSLASRNDVVWGTETYVLGNGRVKHNLAVAKRENQAILLEKDYEKNYEGFNLNSDEGNILLNLYQNAYIEKSLHFAQYVENQFANKINRNSHGVKQAGFIVIKETTMPSVLIESGYLSNDNEERFIASEEGNEKIASSIFTAIRLYKDDIENNKIISSANKIDNTKRVNKTNKKEKQTENENKKTKENNPEIVVEKSKNGGVEMPYFAIQIASNPDKIDITKGKYARYNDILYIKEENRYKYLIGKSENLEKVIEQLQKVKKNGFEDAFIVAYLGDKKITIPEAKKYLRN